MAKARNRFKPGRQRNTAVPEWSRRQDRSAVYRDADGRELFMPLLSMCDYTAASAPGAVCRRIGLDVNGDWWQRLRKQYGDDHWFLGWLRGRSVEVPDGVRILPGNAHKRLKRNATDNEFWVDADQKRFREANSVLQISSAIGLASNAVGRWSGRFEALEWWADSVLFGDAPPENVRILSRSEIVRCRESWNWPRFMAEIGAERDSYYKLLELFPGERLPEWLSWLYGEDAPAGWKIVPQWAVALRRELTVPAVASAAGVDVWTVRDWLQDDQKSQALVDAIHHRRGGNRTPTPRTNAWKGLGDGKHQQRMKRRMIDVAEAATIREACKRVGIKPNTLASFLRDVRRELSAEAADAVKAFAVPEVTDALTGKDRCGAMGGGLFLPSPLMDRFRERARRTKREELLYLVKNVAPPECFRLMFLDWVLPDGLKSQYLVEDGPIVRSAQQPDGPIVGGGFRWKGREFFQLKPLEWRLVRFLWQAENRSASFDDLAEPVWEDAAVAIDQNRFGGARKRANRFFSQNDIPLTIGGEGRIAALRNGNG